jgi:hypothetical protein
MDTYPSGIDAVLRYVQVGAVSMVSITSAPIATLNTLKNKQIALTCTNTICSMPLIN